MTITQNTQSPAGHSEPEALALNALGWILTDDDRAGRLLALTGLTPDILRERLTDRTVLAAVLEFLTAHEPDLLGAADALNIAPENLIDAHRKLGGTEIQR